MKVYVMTDLEGVAGVVSFEDQAYPTGKYYEQAKSLLTAEVNAAVEAMLGEGVEDVLILDGHGAGGIVFEQLHPAAKLMHGRPLAPPHVRDEAVKDYDVCMMIGQHAMAGTTDGNLNHTQNSRTIDYYKLNGRPIGEIAQFALYQGAMDMAMIFLSGDAAACREAEELIPGIVTAAVKKGLSRGSAISVSIRESHRLIREGVRKAIRSHRENPVAPLTWPGPYVLEKRFFHTHLADAAAAGGAKRIDAQTVQLVSDDIRRIIFG